MGVGTTTVFANIVQPGLSAVTYEQFEPKKWYWKDAFVEAKSDLKDEDYQTIAGPASMPEKSEAANISLDEFLEGYKTTLTNAEYALTVEFTPALVEDARYGFMKKVAGMMGKSARDCKEVQAANVFNRGFSDSYTFGDAEPLFGDNSAKTHPLAKGGTWRNTLSTAADLTNTSLEQAIIDIAATVDDAGMIQVLIPKVVIVPTALAVTVKQLLKSNLQAYTDENQVNAWLGELTYVVNPYLTDPDAWFIACQDHNMVFQNRVNLETWTDVDPRSRNLIYGMRQRLKFGPREPRGVFGSPGA